MHESGIEVFSGPRCSSPRIVVLRRLLPELRYEALSLADALYFHGNGVERLLKAIQPLVERRYGLRSLAARASFARSVSPLMSGIV